MRDQKGSILAEFVVVMPILLLLIFGIIQFSTVWIARLMTRYAAFCAARTAIVYNPGDYEGLTNSGPVHRAACIVLAWTSMTVEGNSDYQVHGWGEIPASRDINRQVEVSVEDLTSLAAEKNPLPAVKVTVRFHYPLWIPFAGSIIGHFANGGSGQWDLVFQPDGGFDGNCITLTESWIMPRPWNTSAFPQAPASDRSLWGASR